MITGADVVAEARTVLNTPYRRGAYIKGVGSNCIGVVLIVGLGLGFPEARQFIDDPIYKGYSAHPQESLLLPACDKYLDRVPVAEMTLGDIPLMRYDGSAQHFGIISSIEPFYMIHAYARFRKVLENRIDDEVASRILRVYRFRGVG